MALTNLPTEIILEIAQDLPHTSDKLNFALTCSQMRDIALETLYSGLCYNALATNGRGSRATPRFGVFLQKLLQDPFVVQHSRKLYLHSPYCYPGRPGWGELGCLDEVLSFTVDCMPNLKDLEIHHAIGPYAIYDRPPTLERFYLGDSTDQPPYPCIDMVQPMLALPRIKEITIAVRTVEEESLLASFEEQGPGKAWSAIETTSTSQGGCLQIPSLLSQPFHICLRDLLSMALHFGC